MSNTNTATETATTTPTCDGCDRCRYLAEMAPHCPSLTRSTIDDSRWEILVACLHYRGTCRDLPELARHQRAARLLCDGMGNLAGCEDESWFADALHDWSHVRDSSDAAMLRAAYYLAGALPAEALARILACEPVMVAA